MRYLLEYTHIKNEGRDIAQAIRDRDAVAVTDASVEQKTRQAAISWIITNKTETFRTHGDSGCPQFHAALDSYGAESFGILVTLTVIKVICDFYKIRSGEITIACDNDSSLEKCLQTIYRAQTSDKYFDLLWAVFDLKKSLRIKIRPKRVAGHQDGKKQKLNLYERLNVECDRRSKLFRRKLEIGEIHHRPISFGDNQWNIRLRNVRLSYNLREGIRDHVVGTKLLNKMIERHDITRQAVPLVDWITIGNASKLQTTGDKLWVAKFVSGFTATVIQMKYRHKKKRNGDRFQK